MVAVYAQGCSLMNILLLCFLCGSRKRLPQIKSEKSGLITQDYHGNEINCYILHQFISKLSQVANKLFAHIHDYRILIL